MPRQMWRQNVRVLGGVAKCGVKMWRHLPTWRRQTWRQEAQASRHVSSKFVFSRRAICAPPQATPLGIYSKSSKLGFPAFLLRRFFHGPLFSVLKLAVPKRASVKTYCGFIRRAPDHALDIFQAAWALWKVEIQARMWCGFPRMKLAAACVFCGSNGSGALGCFHVLVRLGGIGARGEVYGSLLV